MKFMKIALIENIETFVIYVVIVKAEASIYLTHIAQLVILQWDKAFTKILIEYFNDANIVLFYLVIELLKNIGIIISVII